MNDYLPPGINSDLATITQRPSQRLSRGYTTKHILLLRTIYYFYFYSLASQNFQQFSNRLIFIHLYRFIYLLRLSIIVLRFRWKIIRRQRNFSRKLKKRKRIFDSKGINKFHKIILPKFPLSSYLFLFLFASCSTESANRLILYILSSPQIWNLAASQRIVFPKLLPGLQANYENHRWQICQRVTSHREKGLFGKEQLRNRDKRTDSTSYEFNIRTT